MKKAVFSLLLAFFALTVPAREYPMFWTWLDYRPGMDFEGVCKTMQEIGMDGIMLNAPTPDDYREAIPVAHKYGIEVYAWLWTLNLEHGRDSIVAAHPEWLSVNRNGKSLADTMAYVPHYKFMCPVLPEVRDYIKDKVRAYCEVEGLNGIAIDYNRLVDVVLPSALWPKYGIEQDREYAAWDYGYHPEMLRLFKEKYGYDPREQADPSLDENWRQFRCDQVTEVANEIADVVHSYGKVMAASPFPTPKMSSRMVRQDWGKWNLDVVFPMVYHTFYTGDVSFIADCTIENARDKKPETVLYCGILTRDGTDLFDGMDAALDNGAQGIAVFTVNNIKLPETKARFREYTDRARQRRIAEGGELKAASALAADPDPFSHTGVMKRVEAKMRKIIGNDDAELCLGEYTLTDSYDATRRYRVTDANSNRTFDVSFYLYGDVLSGWSVVEAD